MNFLFIFYLVFLVVYIVFNIYAVGRVWSIRLENDNTQVVTAIYITIVCTIILISLMVMFGLDWPSVKFK